LTSSEKKGMCFIETKNLDGETNLKYKNSNSELYLEYIKFGTTHSDEQVYKFLNRVDQMGVRYNYEKQNPLLYKFNGNIEYEGK